MSSIGISNIKISSDDINWTSIGNVENVKIESENNFPLWYEELSKPCEISFTKRAKKNGDIFERCLYYRKSKKKRIRKKYDIKERILVLSKEINNGDSKR